MIRLSNPWHGGRYIHDSSTFAFLNEFTGDYLQKKEKSE